MKPLAFILALAVLVAPAAERLVLHEWGTFTSLQDADGRALGSLNVDTEHLPDFITTIKSGSIERKATNKAKGAPFAHPDITMRLETPVIYLYPPDAGPPIDALNLSVDFKGGWITQFYPNATATAPGLLDVPPNAPIHLAPATVSTLAWSGLKLGAAKSLPFTDFPVWIAPRAVKSALITNPAGETEQFLFYRGVANLNAPLRVFRTKENPFELQIEAQHDLDLGAAKSLGIKTLWVLQTTAGGGVAFRELHADTLSLEKGNSARVSASLDFQPAEFSKANLESLRKSMHAALVADGLFDDEASALLNTWQRAYFRNLGLRVFFLVPRAWTDRVLPLTVSQPCDIVRTMVGRIEVVSPEQLVTLDNLAENREKLEPKEMVPQFNELGRFAGTLLVNRLRTKPTEPLRKLAEFLGVPAFE